jgi:hypothetical protein
VDTISLPMLISMFAPLYSPPPPPSLSAACCLSKAISARASSSSFSVSASFSSREVTWSRWRARCRRWFSRTRLSVCSADTRERLVRGALAPAPVSDGEGEKEEEKEEEDVGEKVGGVW